MISILTSLLIIPFCSYQVSYMKRLNLCSSFSPDHCPPLFIFTRHLGIDVMGFPGGTVVKNLPASAGGARDMGSVPELGGSSGAWSGKPLQYLCLENSMDRGTWEVVYSHGITKSRTWLEHHYHHMCRSQDVRPWFIKVYQTDTAEIQHSCSMESLDA